MKFFIKKLITLIITLLVISFLTFTAFSVIPGDAALSRLGKDATEEQLEREPQSAPFWHSGFRSRCFWQSFPCSSSR